MEQSDSANLPEWKKKYNALEPYHKFLIFITFCFVAVILFSTRTVSNEGMMNSTNPDAVVKSIPSDDIVPNGFTRVIKYKEEDFVPKAGVNILFGLGYLIIVLFTIVFNIGKLENNELLTPEQMRKIVLRWWGILRKEKNADGIPKVTGELDLYNPIPKHHMRFREEKGQLKYYECIIAGKVIDKDGVPQYIVIGVNPYNGTITQSVTSRRAFTRQDLCPNCGDYHDVKQMETEEYTRLKEIMSLKGGNQR